MRQRGAARHLSHDVITIPGTDAPDPPIWLLVRQCGGCCLPAHGELNGARPAQPAGATNAPAPRLLHSGDWRVPAPVIEMKHRRYSEGRYETLTGCDVCGGCGRA